VENIASATSRANDLRTKQSDTGEQETLLEPSKPPSKPTSRSTSYTSSGKVIKKKVSKPAAVGTVGAAPINTPEEDANNWIHRDKLAQIESKELEEFRVGRRVSERVETGTRDKRQRIASPIRTEDEEEYDPYRDEPGTGGAKSFIPIPAGRPGSRIPVPRSVSSSITQSEQGSSGQGTRSRNGSNGWTANAADQSPKSQSSSHGSGNEYQGQNASPPTSPVKSNGSSTALNTTDRSSPTKAKTPAKAGPPATRKVTPVAQRQPSNATKPRNVTPGARSPPELKRPGTSNGMANGARPTTASHRPEGDPPWISTMYKPDPRLPPDQQMLPTHAKRMAQEQWEKEGKTGTVYDREFRLLNSEVPENRNSNRNSKMIRPTSHVTADGERIQSTTLSSRWPLSETPPPGSPRSQSSQRPGTSGTEHGGYKTIPSIAKPLGSTPLNSPSMQLHTMRLPEGKDEDEKKKAGCCACVVM
jgi:hypothetical protein